jgi:hypothetical protein
MSHRDIGAGDDAVRGGRTPKGHGPVTRVTAEPGSQWHPSSKRTRDDFIPAPSEQATPESPMIKTCFCAVVMLIGAAIGANAPATWGDASRNLAMTASGEHTMTIAMAYRPYQHD